MRENPFCYAQFTRGKLKCTSASLEAAHMRSFTMYSRRFLSSPHHFSSQGAHISKKITLRSSQIFYKSISVKKYWVLNSKYTTFWRVLQTTCNQSHTFQPTFLRFSLLFAPYTGCCPLQVAIFLL